MVLQLFVLKVQIIYMRFYSGIEFTQSMSIDKNATTSGKTLFWLPFSRSYKAQKLPYQPSKYRQECLGVNALPPLPPRKVLFYKDIYPFANLYPNLLQLPLLYLYGGSLLSLLYILPATMEDRNEDTEGWGVTLPIYMEREGRTDPAPCSVRQSQLYLSL